MGGQPIGRKGKNMKTYQEVISGKYFSLEEREPHDPDGGEIMKIIITYKEEKPR